MSASHQAEPEAGIQGHKIRDSASSGKPTRGSGAGQAGGRRRRESLIWPNVEALESKSSLSKVSCLRQRPGSCPPIRKALERGCRRKRGYCLPGSVVIMDSESSWETEYIQAVFLKLQIKTKTPRSPRECHSALVPPKNFNKSNIY